MFCWLACLCRMFVITKTSQQSSLDQVSGLQFRDASTNLKCAAHNNSDMIWKQQQCSIIFPCEKSTRETRFFSDLALHKNNPEQTLLSFHYVLGLTYNLVVGKQRRGCDVTVNTDDSRHWVTTLIQLMNATTRNVTPKWNITQGNMTSCRSSGFYLRGR